MKKVSKTVCLLLVLLTVLLTCSGCIELDDLKARQAIDNCDGTISFDGHLYRKVTDKYGLELFNRGSFYGILSEEEIPVLLRGDFGTRFRLSGNRLAISAFDFYVRDDVYDELSKVTVSALDRYSVSFYDGSAHSLVLSDRTTKEIDEAIRNKDEHLGSMDYLGHWTWLEIAKTDRSGTFCSEKDDGIDALWFDSSTGALYAEVILPPESTDLSEDVGYEPATVRLSDETAKEILDFCASIGYDPFTGELMEREG